MKPFLIAVVTALLSLPALAQEDGLMALPGYIDFNELTSVYGEPKVNIAIGGTLLNFVGVMAAKEDPEIGPVFSQLKGVRVSTYATNGNAATAIDELTSVKSSLQSANWVPVVQVNNEGEQVQIFLKLNGELIDGLVLMAVDSEEAVFINVLGNIDPMQLSQVMEKFDVDIDPGINLE